MPQGNNNKSHPSWVCGLKLGIVHHRLDGLDVTPFVGVWIETRLSSEGFDYSKSHPSWVCGLKLVLSSKNCLSDKVTPFVGVWIETLVA